LKVKTDYGVYTICEKERKKQMKYHIKGYLSLLFLLPHKVNAVFFLLKARDMVGKGHQGFLQIHVIVFLTEDIPKFDFMLRCVHDLVVD
jgi:hypothetical protein